jgi:hypothetical protein
MAKIHFGQDIFSLATFLLIENALDGKVIQKLLLLLIKKFRQILINLLILIDLKQGFYSPEDTKNKAAMMMTSSVRESFVNLRMLGMFPAKFKIGWLLGVQYN